MGPAEFWPEALTWARQAHDQTGVLVSVILAQWADETEYGGADWSPNNNPGNVGSYDGQPVATFPTLAEGVAAYVQTMNAPDRPEFAATIRQATTYQEQCYLLGAANPVWASGRYELPGGQPGSALVSIIEQFDLTQYDITQPPSNLTEGVNMTSWQEGGQNHVCGVVNGKAYHWWQWIAPDPAKGQDFTWHPEVLPTP